jgi:hypothetical protein
VIDYRKALLPRQPSPAFSPHSSGQSVLLSQGKAQIEMSSPPPSAMAQHAGGGGVTQEFAGERSL